MSTRKVRLPDGKGGWKDLEGQLLPGAKADAAKQEEALRQRFINDAAELTERLLQFDRAYLVEKGLSKEHRAFAAALYCVNLRETYPSDDGKSPDPGAFDDIARMAAEYYDANAPKKR